MLQHGRNPGMIFHPVGMSRFRCPLDLGQIVSGIVTHAVHTMCMPFAEICLKGLFGCFVTFTLPGIDFNGLFGSFATSHQTNSYQATKP